MNWGYKILFVYLAFVAGIVVMVFKSSTQKIDLVTKDYYAQELQYQQRIDALNRAGQLSAPVRYKNQPGKVSIQLPAEFIGVAVEGKIALYCPSNNQKDTLQIFNSTDGKASIAVPAGGSGHFVLQVNWQAAEKTYYFEEKLFL
jgi:hypothetical protein